MRQLTSVLIIDDSRADNLIHTRWLHRSGVVASRSDVLTQPNGREALRFLKQWAAEPAAAGKPFPPELILLDINMPLMDGFEFLDALQDTIDTERLSSTVLLMLSSSSASRDRERAAQYPIVRGYITKPLVGAMISQIMDEHFREP